MNFAILFRRKGSKPLFEKKSAKIKRKALELLERNPKLRLLVPFVSYLSILPFMNECTFLLHIFAVISFLYLSLFLGKEALTTFIAASWLFANFFVTKQIVLFNFDVTASDVYAIGGMIGLSMLQEYWGRDAAKRAVKITFGLLFFAITSALLHVSYIPSIHDTAHSSFAILFAPGPRLIAASILTFILTQQVEIALFSFLKNREKTSFALRTFLTVALIQGIDTLLFTFIGLYGLVYLLRDILIVSYAMKLLILCMTAPCIALSKYLLPKSHDAISI